MESESIRNLTFLFCFTSVVLLIITFILISYIRSCKKYIKGIEELQEKTYKKYETSKTEWLKTKVIVKCPNCGAVYKLDPIKNWKNTAHVCSRCEETFFYGCLCSSSPTEKELQLKLNTMIQLYEQYGDNI